MEREADGTGGQNSHSGLHHTQRGSIWVQECERSAQTHNSSRVKKQSLHVAHDSMEVNHLLGIVSSALILVYSGDRFAGSTTDLSE